MTLEQPAPPVTRGAELALAMAGCAVPLGAGLAAARRVLAARWIS
jgi:hypothetical protein